MDKQSAVMLAGVQIRSINERAGSNISFIFRTIHIIIGGRRKSFPVNSKNGSS
jgi:hypothetical protein